MKTGLVLGGGGLVGMAYHAGALRAMSERGLAPEAADLIVGTSAGSVIGSYLAAGWAPTDFYDFAHGRHPDSTGDHHAQRAEMNGMFVPLYRSRSERIRRGAGGLFALASSRGLWRLPQPPAVLRRAFPSGIYSTDVTRDRLYRDLPEGWPERDLFISTAELYTGKRVVFGAPGSPPAPLPEAVLASTAIPGFFGPVRIGDKQYVDGGVISATSLDLATAAGCDRILCVAPLGYIRGERILDPRLVGPMVLRQWFAIALRREVLAARAKGVEVLVLRPWARDLNAHGTNAMRYFDRAALAERARVGTLELLDRHEGHPVIEAFSPITVEEDAG